MKNRINHFALTLFLILFCLSTIVHSDSKEPQVENFILYDIHGKRNKFYDLFRDLPAKGILLLNFTSINCKPCRKEIPELKEIVNKAGNRARLVCVFAEPGAEAIKTASILGISDMSYEDPLGSIQKRFRINKIPVTILVNKKYKMIGRFEEYSQSNILNTKKLIE